MVATAKPKQETLNKKITLHCGDCLVVLPTLAENSIDACVTDPPYHLQSIVKRFGGPDAAPAQHGHDGAYARASKGFMGKQWDGGDVAFRKETWQEVYRVLKPGGYVLAFGGTRNYHRLACAIEDAGFEIRDMISWLYGSGFPKSHNVGKGIDKAAGVRGHDSTRFNAVGQQGERTTGGDIFRSDHPDYEKPQGITPAAREWQGWGTALKPACEPICMARKPLSEKTVAANVLKWGTGAINVDGCRIESDGGKAREGEASQDRRYTKNGSTNFAAKPGPRGGDPSGRWPANVAHDGSSEVAAMFPNQKSGGNSIKRESAKGGKQSNSIGKESRPAGTVMIEYPDKEGSAARFFYSSKADGFDRIKFKHATVKPVNLMQWLVGLVTPPGGVVLDPFAGTGTTGEAAYIEQFRAVLIEREAEYQANIRTRIKSLTDRYVLDQPKLFFHEPPERKKQRT